ncbi:3-oxoacyl-[acyl-carrier-protein] reductase FabG [Exaiptasia diaphana]|nr:3-oxoacyl-[acyl-carrier-protein] reductase FabG [Exaiptasia diaphana]
MNTTERQPKFALITGGTRGIGYGIAKKLAESGHDMILGYSSNHERAEKAKQELTSSFGVRVFTVAGDVRNYAIKLAPRRITCNCIIPGLSRTDAASTAFGQGDEKKLEELAKNWCPMKSIIDPDDIDYVGYTRRHLYQRIQEHHSSSIGNHYKSSHGFTKVPDLSANFKILKKCSSKTDCLIYEMLFIKKIKPSLNVQSDSIKAKIFT